MMTDDFLKPLKENQIVAVGGAGADIAGFDSFSIQRAVNALRSCGGGIVSLAEGTFDVYGPVRLFDNIHLKGTGAGTVLRKVNGARARLMEDADYGELKVTVDDPGGFRTGMGLQVCDSRSNDNWMVTTAVITAIFENTLHIDNNLISDYEADLDGFVSNACSVIEGVGSQGIRVSDLSIDGNKGKNEYVNGCRGGGIYFHKSSCCHVDNVRVADFNGDGISWQITDNVTVKNCEVSGCSNFGLHPGTGSSNTVVEGCDVHGNGSDGIFVCWRVQHGDFRDNRIHHNSGCGIDIGHKDTDNRFSGNHIYENGTCGVLFRAESRKNGAHRNVFIQNIIENNGSGSNGSGILIDSFARDTVIRGNIIRDTGLKLQRTGILANDETPGISIDGNDMSGHAGGDIVNVKHQI